MGGMHISRTRNHSSASSSQTWEVKPWAQVGVYGGEADEEEG